MTPEEFINETELDISKIYRATFLKPSPDTWFKLKHRIGDEIHSKFYNIFGIEPFWHKQNFYTEDTVFSKYEDKEYPISHIVNAVKNNKDRYVNHIEDNETYPIWFAHGIHVEFINKYGNVSSVSTCYYLKYESDESIQNIINYINNRKS